MADGRVIIDTQLNSSGAEKGVTALKKGLTGIGSVAKVGLGVAAAGVGAVTTGITALGAYSIKTGMEFEAGMSKVGAISGASAKEMEQLTDKAKEMGAKTKFSASEAADAFSYMAMAGWKSGDMLNGIEGIMDLAAASGEDLATTSDIVTDALTAFGLTAKDSGRFADVLAQASSNANTNVGLMGETFKYVAPVAGALGYSAEDTAVAIGLMANSGIRASSAGTALRSIFTNLAKPSKSVATAMKDLGISLTDSSGKMKPLNELMVDMREKFAGLTKEQKAQYAASLAGKTGMSGLLAIVNASDKDFKKLTKSIADSNGAAAKMADTMQNNLSGQITILKSAVEGLAIEIYEKFSKQLTGFVKSGQNIISKIAEGVKNGDMRQISDAILEGINIAYDYVYNNIDMIAEKAVFVVSGILDFVSANLPDFTSMAFALVQKLNQAFYSNVPNLIPSLTKLFASVLISAVSVVPNYYETAVKLIGYIGDAIVKAGYILVSSLDTVIHSAFKAISNVAPWAAPLLNEIEKIWDDISVGFVQAWRMVENAWNNAKTFFTNVFKSIKTEASSFKELEKFGKDSAETVRKIWKEVLPELKSIFSSIQSVGKTTFEIIGNVASDVATTIKPLYRELKPFLTSVFTGIRKAAEVYFPAVAKGAAAACKGVEKAFKAISPYVTAVLSFILKSWVNGITRMIFVANGIVSALKPIFSILKSVWSGDMKSARNQIENVFANIKSKFISIGKNVMQGLADGVKNAAGNAVKEVKNVANNVINSAKNALGIHSPSRVFKKLGEYTMKGFEVGLVDASGNVIKKVNKTMSDVIASAENAANKAIEKYKNIVSSYNETVKKVQENSKKIEKLEKQASKQSGEEKKKTNKEIERLENEQTKLVEKAEKQRTKVKKAENEARKKAAKAYYSDEAKELLAYYDEMNKQPSMVENLKSQAESLEESYSKLEEDHASSMERIKSYQQEALDGIKADYETHYDEVNKIWEEKLENLKKTYETKMSEIAQQQQKLYESTLNFTGLFDEVKAEDVIDANAILANAAEQTAKVEKYYENLEKIKEMDLPEEIKEQFKDMGVNAADQLEVFVNMSGEQIETFVAQWKKRNELSKKLADEWYDEQKTSLTEEFESQQAILEDQHKKDLKRIEEEYKSKKEYITRFFNDMFNTELRNYQCSMTRLKEEAVRQAGEIAAAIKAALAEGTAMTSSEAQDVANNMTDGILSSVRSNLDIHSPSRVFANIADLCLQGFEKPFNNYNPVDLMKPSVNSVMNSVKTAGMQSQQAVTNNSTTNAPTLNFYDSAVSPDAVMRQFNKTMRYGLAGGLA